jgi:esterase/lipase superfamily enzyme
MEFKVYGHGGKPCLVLPSQNGKYFDYENFGMIEPFASRIEAGELQLFSIDSLDGESWDSDSWDMGRRMYMHEQWMHYILDEFYGIMQDINRSGYRAMVTGCSMGAFHAVNVYMRRPDLFDYVIAQSGVYDASYLIGSYMDANVYNNSPYHYIQNLPQDHYYMDLYRRSKVIISVGQGQWEDECLASTRAFDALLSSKGIPVWFDYWGFDCYHDWPWWKKQMYYFLDKIFE